MPSLIKTLNGASNALITSISIAGDGNHVLTGLSPDEAGLDLWSLDAGTVIHHLTGLRNGAASVALDPSGRLAAACSIDTPLITWETGTGAVLNRVPPPAAVSDNNGRVAISADGQVILSAYFGSITLFDTALSHKNQFRVHDDGGTLFSVAIAPGGGVAAVGYVRFDGKNDIKIFDLVSGQTALSVTTHRGSGVTSLAWSGDSTLLSGSGSGALSLTSATNGTAIRSFAGHTGPVQSVAVAANGRLAASGGADSTAKVWDVATGGLLASFDHAAQVNGVAFTPDAKFVLSGGGTMVKLWSVSD